MFRTLRGGWQRYSRICQVLPKRFELNRDACFIRGAARAAIYDLDVGAVYSISSTGTEVLGLALQGLTPLDIACRVPVSLGGIVAFLDSLVVEERVGSWHEGQACVQRGDRNLAPLGSKLHSLTLDLTRRCNLQCIHCYAESGPEPSNDVLEVADWRQLVGDAALLGCGRLVLTGGEPLLVDDVLLPLIPYANENGMCTTVVTNATLITDQAVRLFYRFGVRVAVSLYGPNGQVHDRVTQVPGSFAATVRNVLNLRMRGVSVGIAMTVMQENQDFVDETERFTTDYLNATFVAAPILPVGRGRSNDLAASTESFLRVASERLIQTATQGRVCLPVRVQPLFPRVRRAEFVARLGGTCWSGRLCIMSNGDAVPCPTARHLVLGDVRRSKLSDIISSDAVTQLWTLNKDRVQICSDCEYRYACRDCHAAVIATGGTLYDKPAWCSYDPYVGEWQSDTSAQLPDRTGKVQARCLHLCPADSPTDGERT